MWTEDPFEHDGHYFKIPPRSVIPKPVQEPHPPLWVACGQPESFLRRRRERVSAPLCFNIGVPEELRNRIDNYRKGIANGQTGGQVRQQSSGGGCASCIAPRPTREAIDNAGMHGLWFMDQNGGPVPAVAPEGRRGCRSRTSSP